jgi:hypothetical protein
MAAPSCENVLVIEKQRLPAFHGASAPAKNNPHGAFGTVNTSDTFPGARALQSSLGRALMALARLTVSRNSFVRFSSRLINSDFFAFIVANTTNPVEFS